MTNPNLSNGDATFSQKEWWVERWLELLDSYRFKKRLERARIYVREGKILSIEFKEAKVFAKVQGSDTNPYQVSLSLVPFIDEDWDYIIQSLSKKAIFSAQLLAGKMPENIEEVFIDNGLSVFPFTLSDINAYCSCPDKANPCKHIGAVYYQLAEYFSEDPFTIFKLRGRTKEQILDALRQLRLQKLNQHKGQKLMKNKDGLTEITKKSNHQLEESKTLDLTKFWQYKGGLDSSLIVIVPLSDDQTVLNILGRITLTYEEARVAQQHLQQVYKNMSQYAVMEALNLEV
ncbi:MAG: SWIM zinc finger family protein [cyanobacterium endosymbiont of Rhopalodia musculus]|uniref:SWIM zinc finger family protein n=1 Tax=cyanobacterium endosymbiont of Epithemia clementina EcSB TaxID=3034674 RepID=UPI0024801F70|nr:SWIM zinc finger family protein [cyanobacterium endosymbiont of Epithemia clementina EcSB]WGT67782.1 SWIM zinc finger family protein [cyanobacterium endosymbiont of Epithemia clementina EcSB]